MEQSIARGASGAPTAEYLPAIRAAASDPRRLEELYHSARGAHAAGQFAADLLVAYREEPQNVLFAAWYYRLQQERPGALRTYLSASWRVAVPLSAALGLAYWLLSDPHLLLPGHVPVLAVLWAPLAALALMAFLVRTTGQGLGRALVLGAGLAAVTAYGILLIVRPDLWIMATGGAGPSATGTQASGPQQTYLLLLVLHLPLLSAGAVALTLLGWRSTPESRFAFLTKGIETVGTAGVASIVGGIFVGLTYGIFAALSVELPDPLLRLLIAGGAGLIPVLAAASVYDPTLPPAEQEFRRGFGRLQATLLRALLPLTLLVLVIYLAVIPFNFRQPFVNRDVLIIYNGLLFAIIALLVGVTPVRADDAPAGLERWLRLGIAALAGLVTLIGLYALSAVLYRTSQGTLTMNRLAVIGWNVLNIGLLALVLARLARPGRSGWLAALHGALGVGFSLYLAWGALLLLALPWLFR
jgi:hypothetical protein